jgi:hypothetical protein
MRASNRRQRTRAHVEVRRTRSPRHRQSMPENSTAIDLSKPRRRGEVPTGHTVSEIVTAARTRLVEHRIVELERELAELRPATRRTTTDPRKLFIREFAARHPGVTGRALAIALDNSELRPLPSWTRATGLRLWMELWDCKNTRIQRAVRKYVYAECELSPRVTTGLRGGS